MADHLLTWPNPRTTASAGLDLALVGAFAAALGAQQLARGGGGEAAEHAAPGALQERGWG